MSSIASIAVPGKIRTSGGGSGITPESLFSSEQERAAYKRVIDAGNSESIAPDVKVKGVHVKIFDMSNSDEVDEYERLWKELLEKTSKNEVIVESRKDLVNRKDGTSYWMKYVEYVEFGDASDERKVSEGDKK